MAAYMIVIAKITDRDAFLGGYAVQAAKLVEKFGGEYLLRSPEAELLEGAFGEGASVVVSKWSDREAALAFWNSSEYAKVKKMREPISQAQVLLVDGPDLVIRESD